MPSKRKPKAATPLRGGTGEMSKKQLKKLQDDAEKARKAEMARRNATISKKAVFSAFEGANTIQQRKKKNKAALAMAR